MSEIYNGTFVLGNTSATTLSAGPGIKIDDSQPGVIKVSNDETVLWSGARTNSVTLSESAYNFEFIRIELDEGNSNAPNPVITIKPTSLMTFSFGFGDANAFIAIVKATLTNNTALEFTATKSLKFGSFTSTQVSITAELDTDQVKNSIVKVIGINRISGGN